VILEAEASQYVSLNATGMCYLSALSVSKDLFLTIRTLSFFSFAMLLSAELHAHHEAIFGPQSAALLPNPGYVSVQYYFANEGRARADLIHSNIGILSAATRITGPWA
jgi:hypothetical protein